MVSVLPDALSDHPYLLWLLQVVGDVALQLHAGAPFTVIEFVN